MDPYYYEKLKEDDSIRLLVLQPGRFESPIACLLGEVRLSSRLSYEALSYTWGEPVPDHAISINGRSKTIRHNLYMALLSLRLDSRPRVFWIDALTINQEDNTERNQQVKIMGEIYKQSRITTVWLKGKGEATVVETALNVLRHCDTVILDKSLAREEKKQILLTQWFENEGAKVEKTIASIHALISSDWFGRMWVVQEFALSPCVYMCCGNSTFSIEALSLLHEILTTSPSARITADALTEPLKQLLIFMNMREIYQHGGHTDLNLLLFGTSRMEATEPKDDVFALLSLVDSPEQKMIADYNLTTPQIYSSAMRIGTQQQPKTLFQMVGLACRRPLSNLKHNMPSWTPDFHHVSTSFRSLQSKQMYSAGTSSPSAFSFSDDDLVLIVRAKVIDGISTLYDDPPPKHSPWNMYRDWYTRCKRLAAVYRTYPTGEQFEDCWWRFCICDLHVALNNEVSRAAAGFGGFYLEQALHERLVQEEPLRTAQIEYLMTLSQSSAGLSFCRTAKQYWGWASEGVQVDDKICLFAGADAPWVIRPKNDGSFQLLGEAYIHGIMDGEALAWEDNCWQDIRLS